MVRLPLLLFGVFLCACGSGATGQRGGQGTGGTTGTAGARGDAAAAGAAPEAGVDASGLPLCPEIVAAKFGQVGANCLRGCEVPEANDSGILGIIPVCRLSDADAKAFSLAQPAYCVLPESTTILCTGADASP
jgi:hypothetical protein